MHVPVHWENVICRQGYLCSTIMLDLCYFVTAKFEKITALAFGDIAILITCSALVWTVSKHKLQNQQFPPHWMMFFMLHKGQTRS